MNTARRNFLFVVFALSFSLAHAGEKDQTKPVILLTGFEPFMSIKVNPSWETAKTFQDKEIGGYRVETVRLPVVYDAIHEPLQKAVEKFKPEIVICFGVGSKVMQVETVARNGYHKARPPDNNNARPTRDEIVPGKSATIFTQLPTEKILAALKEAKIGAKTSTDAGGYLCNECFYRLMSIPDGPKIRGFVHVPDYNTTDPEGGVFDAEKLKQAVEVILKTVTTPSK